MSARFRGTRVAAVVLGASLAVLGAALPAAADDGGHDGGTNGVSATRSGGEHDVKGDSVVVKYRHRDGKTRADKLSTALLGLRVNGKDGSLLHTYCVQITVHLKNGSMHEAGWDKYPDENSPFRENNAKINWILHNSYPQVNLDTLANAAGTRGLDKQAAIAATQAAIWHYSDDATLVKDKNSDVVDAVYEYLTGTANKGIDEQPAPSLKLSPNSVTGKVGGLVGPITIKTNSDAVQLSKQLPKGIEITDADGTKLDLGAIGDGTKIYFKVPSDVEPDAGSITVTGETTVPTGRLFVNDNYDRCPSQSLIVASSDTAPVSKKATVTWTPATAPTTTTGETAPPTSSGAAVPTSPNQTPTTSQAAVANASDNGDLAYTGVAIGLPIGIAALLLVGGGALLILQRKRKGNNA